MNQSTQSKAPISEVLRRFRTRYNLTQQNAAKWCLIGHGTYRDYEQGRTNPLRIVQYGILRRIAEYETGYKELMRTKRRDKQREYVAKHKEYYRQKAREQAARKRGDAAAEAIAT